MQHQGQLNSNRNRCRLTAAGALLIAAGLVVVIARTKVGPGSVRADAPPTYPLIGIVRDFAPDHPDFAPGAADNLPYSVGNIVETIDENAGPVYQGGGAVVQRPARDSSGRAIMPGPTMGEPITDFSISGAKVFSKQPASVRITVIGSAITSGGAYDIPVTTRVHVGSSVMMPFGDFDLPLNGNVNDGNNPRATVLPQLVPAGTPISIDGRSWLRRNASSPSTANKDWESFMFANSLSPGQQVHALRNGDKVPAVKGFLNQVSAKSMLGGYFDASTEKMTLSDNQIIYLFELGTDNTGSAAFDIQDLVVLVELATDPSFYNDPTPETPSACVVVNDVPAALGGGNAGGIASAATFGHWFDRVPGQNMSDRCTLLMTRDAEGNYVYEAADFHPIDGKLYGNQNQSHNRGLTLAIDAIGTYSECKRQFFEFKGDGDAWLYINGKLAIDMGGLHVGASQFVDLDRLGLNNGEDVRLQFFAAQRSTSHAAFMIKTNMVLQSNVSAVQAPPTDGLAD